VDSQRLRSVQAVLGFLGALGSGRGWRLYLLFSRGGGVDVCLANVSKAETESEFGEGGKHSGSSDNKDGTPLNVAISR
jgi:hypothetical protein